LRAEVITNPQGGLHHRLNALQATAGNLHNTAGSIMKEDSGGHDPVDPAGDEV
jgi:hypothetical protein